MTRAHDLTSSLALSLARVALKPEIRSWMSAASVTSTTVKPPRIYRLCLLRVGAGGPGEPRTRADQHQQEGERAHRLFQTGAFQRPVAPYKTSILSRFNPTLARSPAHEPGGQMKRPARRPSRSQISISAGWPASATWRARKRAAASAFSGAKEKHRIGDAVRIHAPTGLLRPHRDQANHLAFPRRRRGCAWVRWRKDVGRMTI